GDVLKTEMDCFRHAEPGTCQQGKEGVVGVPAKGIASTQHRSGLEYALDFLPGKNVGHRSRPLLAAENRGRYFVVWILRTNVPQIELPDRAGALVEKATVLIQPTQSPFGN